MGYEEPTNNLRQTLRKATAQAHNQLDSTMRAVAGWNTIDDYARFLSLQYIARRPVEAWIEANAPIDLRPPPQTPLIAADLQQLDRELPSEEVKFDPTGLGADARSSALGAAWVLAGSSLGNRSILGEIKRKAASEGWIEWPSAFVGDPQMLAFWKQMRAEIENSAEMETVLVAIRSANEVFGHFLAHAQDARAAT